MEFYERLRKIIKIKKKKNADVPISTYHPPRVHLTQYKVRITLACVHCVRQGRSLLFVPIRLTTKTKSTKNETPNKPKMFRKTRLASLWGPQKTRVSNPTVRPLFREAGATHLYASKQNASEADTAREGVKKLGDRFLTFGRERGTQYYFAATAIIGLAISLYIKRDKQKDIVANGLAGPKKRNYRSRLTIVLDVDETLVSYGDKAYRLKAGVVPRPFLAELLDYLVTIDAEVILWSSCSEGYMMEVISVLDPTQTKISQTITRDKTWFTGDNYYEKNLSWLKRDMDSTLIVENRALSVRNCNANAILVDDFLRGEYVDTGVDLPRNDRAMKTLRDIIEDLEVSGRSVPEYLADMAVRNPDIKEIPCERAIRQLRDELARGVFYFIGDKYVPGATTARVVSKSALALGK